MSENGFIVLHRKIIEWEWYSDPLVFRLFLHLLLTANHTSKKWRGNLINRGELITSYPNLADQLTGSQQARIGVQQIRTAIGKLKSTGELTVKTTNRFSLIKLNNYEKYQNINRQSNTPVTVKQQATNSQLTTNNNGNNVNNDNKYIVATKKSFNDVTILHDGTRAKCHYGTWVDANDPNVKLDLHYYPELTK